MYIYIQLRGRSPHLENLAFALASQIYGNCRFQGSLPAGRAQGSQGGVYIYIYIYIYIYGHIWTYTYIYGNIWPYMAIYMAIYDHIWPYIGHV